MIPAVLAIAHRASLFSHHAKATDHVRSGQVAQWRQYFTPKHKGRFIELFGDALLQLGYEKDHDWTANASDV
jgi:hypothetical protein